MLFHSALEKFWGTSEYLFLIIIKDKTSIVNKTNGEDNNISLKKLS